MFFLELVTSFLTVQSLITYSISCIERSVWGNRLVWTHKEGEKFSQSGVHFPLTKISQVISGDSVSEGSKVTLNYGGVILEGKIIQVMVCMMLFVLFWWNTFFLASSPKVQESIHTYVRCNKPCASERIRYTPNLSKTRTLTNQGIKILCFKEDGTAILFEDSCKTRHTYGPNHTDLIRLTFMTYYWTFTA